ncbi:amidase family protein [Collimonas arenae]|uniref:Amidase family protein n=1 Tax=Collimonas arenae TaxID=279058 RepID=A0A127QK28_9BURK|nr:amidase [Collimonas arenae]AMP09932.1 amidase family protein [Collimonas arenae]
MKTIRTLAAELQAGTNSSVKLVEQALAQIEAHRAAGGAAYIHVDAAQALAAARASDAARAAGYAPSLLAGLPVSIKDLFDVKGQVTAAGSTVLADAKPATADAAAVARLRNAGAILLGRTNMSEFAFSGLGLNPHYGTPTNPFDSARVAGGSTSGGAVSVAGGMAVAALGTDTGGSIRIPSAFCGLTGFKPTARRVDLSGAVPLSTTLDSAGPLTHSVDCCAIVDAILSGELLDSAAVPLQGLRFGVTEDFVGEGIAPEVRDAFENVLNLLERAGAHIERFTFPELKTLPTINAGGGFTAAEAWAWHRALLESSAERYDQRVAARIRRGGQQSAADYIDLLAARRNLIAAAQQRLRPFDAWLMPTVATLPPLLQSLQQSDDTFFATNGLVLRNPAAINFLDGCALNLPCPVGSGLPVGFSICGLAGQDARVLQIGRAVEAALQDA